jgi:hypothetical protein
MTVVAATRTSFVIEVIEHVRLSLKELDLSDRFWLRVNERRNERARRKRMNNERE